MANVNSPFGGKPFSTLTSTDFSGKTNMYVSSVSDATPIYVGDAVKLSGGANSTGIAYVSQATSSDDLIGFVVAIKNIFRDEQYTYRKANTELAIYIIDDPFAEFEIQANGVVTAADIGKEANIVVSSGNTITGLSGIQLDTATLSYAPAQLKILGVIDREGNQLGQYVKLRVMISMHALKDKSENIFNRDPVTGNITTANAGDSLELDGELVVNNNATIDGKLTVTGLIDPTGLTVTPQITPPSTDNGTHYYNSTLKNFQFRADGKWVYLPQLYPTINIPSDFPTLAEVFLGATYRIGTNVIDNDPSKTNTGQSFLAGQEIFWNGTNWTIAGDTALWGDNLIDLYPISAGRNINLLTGGLKDSNVTTAIKLGDSLNTSFDTSNKTIIGAVNLAYQWDRSLLGGSVYYVTPRHSGDVLKIKNYIYLGVVDAFSRTQFWNYEANSIIRLGALAQDGDPVNASSEGIVIYGQNAQGDAMGATDWGYFRVKPYRIGLYNSKTAGYVGYLFKLDTQTNECYLKDNSGNKTFDFNRLTSEITIQNSAGTAGINWNGTTLLEFGDSVSDTGFLWRTDGTYDEYYNGNLSADNEYCAKIVQQSNAASMTGTENGFYFQQTYYDATTPLPAAEGYIGFRTEGNWTSTLSSQDSSYIVRSAKDGVLVRSIQLSALNTSIGKDSGPASDLAAFNVMVGYQAGSASTAAASANTYVGYQAGQLGTSASNNVGIGYSACENNITGNNNAYVGYYSGRNATGSNNAAFGADSAHLLTSGGNNTLIGCGAGFSLTTQSGNVFIGYQAGYASTDTNTLIIANSNTATPLIKGDFSNNTATLYGIWSYNSHPTFTSDTQLVDKKYVDDLAGTQTPKKETLSVTGSATVTLSETPYSEDTLLLIRNGAVQKVGAGNDYTRSGAVITFEYDVTGQTVIAYYTY